jgi:cobalt-zinc-cadmium efflux system outer membrane protein
MRRFRSPAILLSKMVLAAIFIHTSPTYAAPPTLKEAVEAAWAKRPEAKALAARQEEVTARREAASAWFPAPPSIALGQRTDRYNDNRGDRETEAEIAFPLWMPGTKSAAQRVAQAESSSFDIKNLVNKLQVAKEVREAYWQARLAQNEHHLTVHQASEAAELMLDVERRFKVGELARTDFNQARITERIALSKMAEAEAREIRALKAFTALTGMTKLPESAEALATGEQSDKELPQLASLNSAVDVQRARLAQVSADRREPPKLSVGMVRERPAYSDSYENSVRVSVTIPLATHSRNAPRISAANAELIEAEATLALGHERLQAEVEVAKAELEQARKVALLAQERHDFAEDTQVLHKKAFRLGELDLPTLLRSENEHFESELELSRARIDVGRAISRVNQALGLLP